MAVSRGYKAVMKEKHFCDQVSPVSGSVEMLNGPSIPFQKHLLSKIYQEILYIYSKMLSLGKEYPLASLFSVCVYKYNVCIVTILAPHSHMYPSPPIAPGRFVRNEVEILEAAYCRNPPSKRPTMTSQILLASTGFYWPLLSLEAGFNRPNRAK